MSQSCSNVLIDRAIYTLAQRHPHPVNSPVIVVSLADLIASSPAKQGLSDKGDTVPLEITDNELLQACVERISYLLDAAGSKEFVLLVLAATDDGQTNGKQAGRQRALPGIQWWVWNYGRIPRGLRKGTKRLVRTLHCSPVGLLETMGSELIQAVYRPTFRFHHE